MIKKSSKIQISNYKLIFLLFSIFYILNTTYYIPAFAADSSQSATMSADFKSKLKALQEGIASQAAKFKLEISQKLQNKAYIGLIESKGSDSLTLNIDQNKKQVITNEYTEFTGKGKVSFKSLVKDDYIAALGDIDDKDVLTAKKIIQITSASPDEKQIFYGQVISIDGNNINIKTKDNPNVVITTDSNTTYQLGKEPASSVSINVGKTIIAITIPSNDSTFKARFIYILSQRINIKSKTATTSATPDATKAAESKKKIKTGPED